MVDGYLGKSTVNMQIGLDGKDTIDMQVGKWVSIHIMKYAQIDRDGMLSRVVGGEWLTGRKRAQIVGRFEV